MSRKERPVHLPKNIWFTCLASRTRRIKGCSVGHLHMGIVKKQIPTCTLAIATNTGFTVPWTSQSNPLNVSPKLKRFLNTRRQVKPSTDMSPTHRSASCLQLWNKKESETHDVHQQYTKHSTPLPTPSQSPPAKRRSPAKTSHTCTAVQR
jgi:hypothetical protein